MSRDLGKSPSQPPDVARDDDAMLGEDATYLIHDLRAASHHALSYPMEGLDRQLFGGLRRNKAHRGSADCLADSLCIIPIIFVRLHIRRHKLRAYQAHLVTELRKHTCPRTVRSFHPDQARRQIGKKRRHRSTTQGFSNDYIPLSVNAMTSNTYFAKSKPIRTTCMMILPRCSPRPTFDRLDGRGSIPLAPWQELSDVAAALVGCGHV